MRKHVPFALVFAMILASSQYPVRQVFAETASGTSTVRVAVSPEFLQFIKGVTTGRPTSGSPVSADTIAVVPIRLDVSMK